MVEFSEENEARLLDGLIPTIEDIQLCHDTFMPLSGCSLVVWDGVY